MNNPYKQFSVVNPQWERGNRKIASDVYIALTMAPLSGAEYRIALTIINCTWGFKRKFSGMTYSTFKTFTNLSKPATIKATRSLEQQRIILVDRKMVNGCLPLNTYQFNKYYDTWITKTGKQLLTTGQIELVKKFQKNGKQIVPKVVNDQLPHNINSNENRYKTKDVDYEDTEISESGQRILNSIGIKGPDRE